MEIDPDIYVPIIKAFDEERIDDFKQLVDANPEYLIDVRDGTDWWMWSAAHRGNLDKLKTLVSMGLDVNLSKDVPDPENPFCQFEGPILQAAQKGYVEIVSWLLEHGAQINYTINGKVRCLPLLRAATNGHLDVVKVLVEHGAEINAVFNGHTALSQADNYGHPEVAEYLRSVGATE